MLNGVGVFGMYSNPEYMTEQHEQIPFINLILVLKIRIKKSMLF